MLTKKENPKDKAYKKLTTHDYTASGARATWNYLRVIHSEILDLTGTGH